MSISKSLSPARFERSNSEYDGGSSGVVFKLKDGSEISFSVIGSNVIIDGYGYFIGFF